MECAMQLGHKIKKWWQSMGGVVLLLSGAAIYYQTNL